jgi:hypothetical protein
MSVLSDIGDDVVDVLNAAPPFTPTFTAEKKRVIDFDTATVGSELKVWVFALGETIDASSRSQSDHKYVIKVALYKQLATDAATGEPDETAFEQLDQLREAIFDRLLASGVNAPSHGATLVTLANEPVYDPRQLDKHDTFVSVVTLTYILPR